MYILPNILVSIGFDGTPGRGGRSVRPQISGDGRYVLFISYATNLIAGPVASSGNAYLRDLELQTTTRLSVTTNGTSLGSAGCFFARMTPDARYCAFVTLTNGPGSVTSIFWRDTTGGGVVLLSAGGTTTATPSISTNGQRVAYIGNSLYVWDAVASANIYTNAALIKSAALSPGGNRVLLRGTNLMVYDLSTHSILKTWPSADSIHGSLAWSPDERFVTFASRNSLVPGDSNGLDDVYLSDLETGTLTLISHNASGLGSGNGDSDAPTFSGNGRFIVYRTRATNLLAMGPNAPGVMEFDRVTGSNQLVVAASTLPVPFTFSRPTINADGSMVAVSSQDGGLVPGDYNRTIDAFSGGISVLATTDSDGDGIPDWWMQLYFNHPTGQAGDLSRAGDDADGDGFNNLQEFLSGTDPTDATSGLWLQITMTPQTGTNVLLNWPAKTGKNYQVEYTDNVATGWQDLSVSAMVIGDIGSASVSRTNDTRMFRVRCDP